MDISSGRVEALGRTCGQTYRVYLSLQLSGPQRVELSVDGNFFGVSARVALSGVLCFSRSADTG